MKYNLLMIAILVMVVTGCRSKSAFDYSEKLVAIEKSLLPDIRDAQVRVGRYFTNQQFDSAAAASQRMEEKIASKIKEVELMDPPNVAEAENFKRAYLKYFTYMKRVYTTYRQYAMQTTEEKREEVRQQMIRIEDEKKDAIADMQRSQAKFAKANGFRIENQ